MKTIWKFPIEIIDEQIILIMGGFNPTSQDFDEYDASQMSLEQLERQTKKHAILCECVYCYGKRLRLSHLYGPAVTENTHLENCRCGGEARVDYGTLNTYLAKKQGIKPEGPYEVSCKLCGIRTGWQLNSSDVWNTVMRDNTP